jgi:hypothetical protein
MSAAAVRDSTLREQNRLFADAMAAKRRGDTASALASLDELVAKHPDGALSESAYAERMRVLASRDPAAAAAAAREYVARYPAGHAHDEALALTGHR